jgi:glutamyl-tRNA reductase
VLLLLGLNHRSAPLPMRERVGFSEDELATLLPRLAGTQPFREAMVLSTCNRVEVLVRADETPGAAVALKAFVAETKGLEVADLDRYGYTYQGLDVARHLFQVASGLDSMVLGEPQILGQVKRAYALARTAGTTGSIVEHLLQHCLAAAKKVRTDTGISRHAVSVSFAAVTLARQIFGELAGRTVLLLGAGKMTELAARHLVANGAAKIVVANRTYTRAMRLAESFGGTAVNWDEVFTAMQKADIVVTGTAAAQPVVSRADVQQVLGARRGRPLFFIDIAVPRDVEPSVNTLDGVYLYDIDDLQQVVDANLEERKRAAEAARHQVEDEVRGFERWLQSLEVTPTIVSLRHAYQDVGDKEVERYRRRLGELSADQQQAVEELTRAVVNKLLHSPMRHLKEAAAAGQAAAVARNYRQIFGLPELPPEPPDTLGGPAATDDPGHAGDRARFARGREG